MAAGWELTESHRVRLFSGCVSHREKSKWEDWEVGAGLSSRALVVSFIIFVLSQIKIIYEKGALTYKNYIN